MRIHHSGGTVMGGPWQVRHRQQHGITAALVHATTLAALSAVEAQMSHFREDSDLMRINRAPPGVWVEVPPRLYAVLAAAAEMYAYTQGAVDITLGKAVDAWGFGRCEVGDALPSLEALPVSRDRGYVLDGDGRVRKTRDVALNLACIAKGYAVDCAADMLRGLGLAHFMVEAAGEIRAQGMRSPDEPWRIGLELPLPGQTVVYDQIALSNAALAGSGSYRKYREIGGKHYPHTLDPLTREPLQSNVLAVLVRHQSCMYADALATALFVMGAARGSDFAARENLAALFLLREAQGICEIRSRRWMADIES